MRISGEETYFLKIPKNIRSFDVSSGGLSVTTCVAAASTASGGCACATSEEAILSSRSQRGPTAQIHEFCPMLEGMMEEQEVAQQ